MTEEAKISVPESYLRNIEKKVNDLKILLDVSALTSSTLDLDDLMTLVMEKAKTFMNAEACSILFYNRETGKLEFEVAMCAEDSTSLTLKKKITLDLGQGIAGWVAENLQPLTIDDVRKDNRFYQGADKLTGFTTRGIIAAPLVGRSGLIGVVEIINPEMKIYDREIFLLLCKQFAIAIENARQHRESIERERLKQQFEIAAALQKSFLPASPLFEKGGLRVSGINISASKVGGDVYDFGELAGGKVGILIGDVSGKGISAALYMAKFISDFRYVSHNQEEPDLTLNRLNSIVSEAPRGMFLTAIYLIADTATGVLRFSVAGHPPPILIRRGDIQLVSAPSGPPLGMISLEYPASSLRLEDGDRLLLLTDGVFEAKNKTGERIGMEAIVTFIKNNPNDEELLHKIVDYVDDFAGGAERADDITMVEVRWKVRPA